MIEDKELQSLVEFKGANKVLSVYLDTDLAHKAKDSIKLEFRQLIKGLREKPDAGDVQVIEHFLEFEYDWQARGLALFSAGKELWKAIPLPIAVRMQAFVMERPYVRVLTDVHDRFAKYGVALFDRESVRLFVVAWDSVQAEKEASGDELKHHKQGGRAAARLQRHEENLAQHNLRQSIDLAQSFFQENGCKRIVLAGNADVLAQVKELLSKAMYNQVIGEFAADMEATFDEIVNRSLEVAWQFELQQERDMVNTAVTAASKGGAGVIGLADTLYVLHEKRVHQLLVDENYHAPGYACANCGYVTPQQIARCPFCSHDVLNEVPDAVNQAIEQALQTGAEVNVVRENEELAKAGGIVATLRY